jgi:hypothetical protein
VAAASTGTVVITLPPAPAPGDTVTVTGESANSWTLAQNAGQSVVTAGMQGNVAPGASWTARMEPKVWHWLASDASGQVLVAGEAGGNLNTSSDGGLTWTTGDSPSGIWISIDMTPSADRIVAVQYGGGMYLSTDLGASWRQLTTASAGVNLVDQLWESVSVSNDGQGIVAAVQNGPIYASGDGGQTWVAGTTGSPAAALTGWWRASDSSADGLTVVAADHNGAVYRSTDGGLTWSPLSITVDGAPVTDRWYRLRMSGNGQVIALVGNSFGGAEAGNGIYISRDGGTSWTGATSLVADYSAVAMSADGQVITVTVSNPNPNPPPGTVARAGGRVLRSTDGGATFAPITLPGSDTNWRAVAMSSDGNKLAVAAGLFDGAVPGQLYTSLGNRTSVGTLGAITGGQGQTAVLTYLGDGQFSVTGSSGGAFAIR